MDELPPRWCFPHPGEEDARARVLARVDAWWQAFAANVRHLEAHLTLGTPFDVAGFMATGLGAVSGSLDWELGRGLQGGHRLVITPGGHRALRPLTNVLLSRAPPLPGWEFHASRPAEPLAQALASAEARSGGRTPRDLRVQLRQNAWGLVQVCFRSRAFTGPDDLEGRKLAVALLEALAGEQLVDRWVGEVTLERTPWFSVTFGGAWAPLEFLTRRLRGAMVQHLDGLALKPRWEARTWTLMGREPGPDALGREDVVRARTCVPDLWMNAHSPLPFDSCRHSRVGETFCYLKLEGPEHGHFEIPGALEESLHAALVEARCGGVVGAAKGLEHGYIDLALTDVPRALELLLPRLREARVPLRSWLCFFDDELGDEWVGVHEATPPPPWLSPGGAARPTSPA
ncbi:MAG TPA: hypothetical protein VE153_20190 [Myxococcus sp.]|nr:hypothetical protein [Myxococcus sp.]